MNQSLEAEHANLQLRLPATQQLNVALRVRLETPLCLGSLQLVAHARQIADGAHASRVASDDGHDGQVLALDGQEVTLARELRLQPLVIRVVRCNATNT